MWGWNFLVTGVWMLNILKLINWQFFIVPFYISSRLYKEIIIFKYFEIALLCCFKNIFSNCSILNFLLLHLLHLFFLMYVNFKFLSHLEWQPLSYNSFIAPIQPHRGLTWETVIVTQSCMNYFTDLLPALFRCYLCNCLYFPTSSDPGNDINSF